MGEDKHVCKWLWDSKPKYVTSVGEGYPWAGSMPMLPIEDTGSQGQTKAGFIPNCRLWLGAQTRESGLGRQLHPQNTIRTLPVPMLFRACRSEVLVTPKTKFT